MEVEDDVASFAGGARRVSRALHGQYTRLRFLVARSLESIVLSDSGRPAPRKGESNCGDNQKIKSDKVTDVIAS